MLLSREEKINLLVGVLESSLDVLSKIGFVTSDGRSNRFLISPDKADELAKRSLAASVSIDNKTGRAVMYFDPNQEWSTLILAATHEAVHLAQISKGDLEPSYGCTIWKGRKYETLPSSDPRYFSEEHQPWEHEAAELERVIRRELGLSDIDKVLDAAEPVDGS